MKPEHISILATVVMAVFSCITLVLYWRSERERGRNEKRFQDILSAIVLSNLIGPKGGTSISIDVFKQYYKGETKIFG